jgi:hypothetical protein
MYSWTNAVWIWTGVADPRTGDTVATSRFAKADKASLAKKLADALTPEEISKLLGHSNTKTTERYLH